jgi:DNA-binding NarL/FixJ family response regulator
MLGGVTMLGRQSFATILIGKSILLREGLARILSSTNFRILASVSCADDLLPSKFPQHQPPLFIVVHTGDDFDAALEQIDLFRDQHPDSRIAIVADHFRPRELVLAFRAGANGYFVDMTCAAFIKSLELVMMGETIFPLAFLSFVIDPESEHPYKAVPGDESDKAILLTTGNALAPQLSSREKSVLRCLIKGDSNKCIARQMDIAEATVKVHVKAILRKIRVQNRTQAAIWGANNG